MLIILTIIIITNQDIIRTFFIIRIFKNQFLQLHNDTKCHNF